MSRKILFISFMVFMIFMVDSQALVLRTTVDANATPIQITNIIYNGTGIKLVQAYNGTLAKDRNLIKNNTAQGRVYLNTTGLMLPGDAWINGTDRARGTLRVGTKWINFTPALYGFGTMTQGSALSVQDFSCAGSISCTTKFTNVPLSRSWQVVIGTPGIQFTSVSDTYFLFTELILPGTSRSQLMLIGNKTRVWYSGMFVNFNILDQLNVSRAWFGNGTYAKIQSDKIHFNRTISANGSITARSYLLGNGSIFDVIYGRDSNNQTLASGLIKNNTAQGKIYLNSTLYTTRNISLIYPATALFFGQGSQSFYNHTIGCEGLARCGFKFLFTPNIDKWLLLSPAGLGTTTLDPTFLSSTKRIAFLTHIFPAENNLFDLGTTDSGGPLYWRNVSSHKFSLKNGSNFDALYGRTSLTATIQNNSAQGKIYLNASNGGLFVNSNITARRFYLTNGSNFDTIYGARGSGGGVSNNTFDLFTSLKINATRITAKYGTLSNNITIGNVGSFGMNITGRYINISNGGSIILNGKDIGTRRWTIQFVADANGAGFLCTNCPTIGTEFNPVVITNMTGVRAGRVIAFCDVACDVDTNISIINGGNLPYFYVAGPNAAATAEAGEWKSLSLAGDQSFNVMIKGGGAAQDDYRVTNIYLELMT